MAGAVSKHTLAQGAPRGSSVCKHSSTWELRDVIHTMWMGDINAGGEGQSKSAQSAAGSGYLCVMACLCLAGAHRVCVCICVELCFHLQHLCVLSAHMAACSHSCCLSPSLGEGPALLWAVTSTCAPTSAPANSSCSPERSELPDSSAQPLGKGFCPPA